LDFLDEGVFVLRSRVFKNVLFDDGGELSEEFIFDGGLDVIGIMIFLSYVYSEVLRRLFFQKNLLPQLFGCS
jgi:hypothetical protein